MLDRPKSSPEIEVTVNDGFVSVTVEVFDATPEHGDSAYPTRITLRHDGTQLSGIDWGHWPANGVALYVRGSWEAGDLERLFLAAARAVRLSGLPQEQVQPK